MIRQHSPQAKAINDLPPELITSILEAVLRDAINLPYCLGGDYLGTFKDFAMACTRWKSIIQTTPSFRTVIDSTITSREMTYMPRKSGKCNLTFKYDDAQIRGFSLRHGYPTVKFYRRCSLIYVPLLVTLRGDGFESPRTG